VLHCHIALPRRSATLRAGRESDTLAMVGQCFAMGCSIGGLANEVQTRSCTTRHSPFGECMSLALCFKRLHVWATVVVLYAYDSRRRTVLVHDLAQDGPRII